MKNLPVHTAVKFILDNETVTGSHLSCLMDGLVIGESVKACDRVRFVPVAIYHEQLGRLAFWIEDSNILSVTRHPSQGAARDS